MNQIIPNNKHMQITIERVQVSFCNQVYEN